MDFQDALNKRRGYDVFEKEAERIEQESGPHRFWLPPEKSAKLIFLDDDPPIISEHQLKIRGNWRNWFTCLRMINEECPICDILDDNPYTVGFYTVIDTSEWEDKSGKLHMNEKKLLPAKFKALKILKKQSQKREGLKHCVFEAYRTGPDAFNIGDNWDYEGKINESQIRELENAPEDLEPFNYAEILKPLSPAELKKRIQGGNEVTSEDDFDDDKIQF